MRAASVVVPVVVPVAVRGAQRAPAGNIEGLGSSLVDDKSGNTMRVVSYNLREHTAKGEIQALAEDNAVDVLCLQEADTNDIPDSFGAYTLAASTRNNRLGLAAYYRAERFELLGTQVYALKKSMHDRVMSPAHERLLAMHLHDRISGQDVLIGSFHAAPLTASNALRKKQVESAHGLMRALAPGVPMLMVGDFNYPWFHLGLKKRIERDGFTLTRSSTPTYLGYKYVKGHFDFATSYDLVIEDVVTLPAGVSDHRPILVRAQGLATA